ncbi:MAG: O-antigen ligase family protein [Candidatus Eremiobacteraeota bacterium]|nr:O-antigen ligase family protein [Candidatus Eremiobacteraeota bacterium]
MFAHPVVDQTIHKHALDALGVIVYFLTFVGVAVATRKRASYGIAALVVADPFAFYRDVGETTLTLPKVVLLAVIASLLTRPHIARAAWSALGAPRARILLWCAGAIVAATALSIVQAEHRVPALRETLKALEYAVLFATVVVAAAIDAWERPVRVAFAATLAVVSIAALSQELFGAPSGFWFFNHPIPRIAGPLEGPNQFAGYLGLMLPVVTAFVLLRRPSGAELAVLGIASMALVLTLSRSGVVASAFAVILVLVLAPSPHRRAALISFVSGALAGLLVLVLFGSTSLLARFSSFAEVERSGGVGTRAQLWHAAIALWRQHPILGIGAGNFEFEIARVGPPGIRTHANSLYLQALVEGGVPLFLATCATVIASIVTFLRASLREPLVLGALAASAGLAVHQVFDFLVFYPKVGGLWWIVLGVGVARAAYAGALAPDSPNDPAGQPSVVFRLRTHAPR